MLPNILSFYLKLVFYFDISTAYRQFAHMLSTSYLQKACNTKPSLGYPGTLACPANLHRHVTTIRYMAGNSSFSFPCNPPAHTLHREPILITELCAIDVTEIKELPAEEAIVVT